MCPNPFEEISHQGRDFLMEEVAPKAPEPKTQYMAPESYLAFERKVREMYPIQAGDPESWTQAHYFKNAVEQKLIERLLELLRPT